MPSALAGQARVGHRGVSVKRIIFVDDEAPILDGLRDVLRKQRSVWEMTFVVGAAAALAELERQPFDVIVTDIRMPGMDGATLLEKVKQDYPSSVRIVLSGQAEPEAARRAMRVAHQFLSKPCDGETLRSVIDRACNLQNLLHAEALRAMVGRLRTLPSLPQVYVDITNAMERPNTTMGDIAAIVERDPALVAKTFQIVNSAYFGTAREITCVQEAVRYLGIDAMKSLVLTEHLLVTMRCPKFDGFSLGEFQRHSWMTARLAKSLLRDGSRANHAYSAGVLHDIGTVILACAAPDQFAAVLAAARETKRQVHDVERELMGTTHAEAGAYLLGIWGLPFWMVEAVAFHHNPSHVTTSGRDVLLAVHVGDRLVSDFVEPPDALEETFRSLTDEERGLMLEQSKWKALVKEEAQGAGVA